MRTDLENSKSTSINTRLMNVEKEINSLRVTIIGIDGQNGMRSQLTKIESKMESMDSSIRTIAETLQTIQDREQKCPLIYSTKEENRFMESKLIQMMEDMEKERVQSAKSDTLRSQDIRLFKYGLYLTGIGLLSNIIIPFFFK